MPTLAPPWCNVLAFPRHEAERIFAAGVHSVAVLGTVHSHRQRWNPFDSGNSMQRAADGRNWLRWFNLNPRGGRHGDGVYNLRFILNHNPRRVLKLLTWGQADAGGPRQSSGAISAEAPPAQLQGRLVESALGDVGGNLSIRVLKACAVCILVDPEAHQVRLCSPEAQALTAIHQATSLELNGFIWDDADAFAKFDERAPGRSLRRISDELWEISVPLKRNGGIDFRHDGVYQFLISRNGDEDQGFAALNRDHPLEALELVEGSGFGSSHGTCRHSAPTLRVLQDGLHRFSVQHTSEGRYHLWVRGPQGEAVPFLNQQASSMQVLGTVFAEQSFDPTQPQASMTADDHGQRFSTEVQLNPGTYSINFAIGRELFLDTMGLGCWLRHDGPGLRGIGWHGKPNELNIGFHVRRAGRYRFSYDRSTDQFAIDPLGTGLETLGCLEAVTGIESLSLVGNFPAPLASWDPESDQNLMVHLGAGQFEKLLSLEANVVYEFKFVANRSMWQIVFADYELDGYGMAYDGPLNPQPFDTTLAALKHYGHLTSHGNPPTIKFVARQSGLHRVRVDLSTGAYNLEALH